MKTFFKEYYSLSSALWIKRFLDDTHIPYQRILKCFFLMSSFDSTYKKLKGTY